MTTQRSVYKIYIPPKHHISAAECHVFRWVLFTVFTYVDYCRFALCNHLSLSVDVGRILISYEIQISREQMDLSLLKLQLWRVVELWIKEFWTVASKGWSGLVCHKMTSRCLGCISLPCVFSAVGLMLWDSRLCSVGERDGCQGACFTRQPGLGQGYSRPLGGFGVGTSQWQKQVLRPS